MQIIDMILAYVRLVLFDKGFRLNILDHKTAGSKESAGNYSNKNVPDSSIYWLIRSLHDLLSVPRRYKENKLV